LVRTSKGKGMTIGLVTNMYLLRCSGPPRFYAASGAVPNEEYQWKTYPNGVLEQDAHLTRSLAHHTVEELSISFTAMIKGLFSDVGSPTSQPKMKLKPPKVSVSEAEAFSASGAADASATKSVFAKTDKSGNRIDNQTRGHDPGMFPGRVRASRNSTLMELLRDKDGNPKSQPVIIMENIIRQMADVLEAHKNQENRADRLMERVDTLLGRNSVTGEELTDIVEAYKEVLTTRMRDLDEAVNLVKAFPAVIEESKGLIDKEIQPSALLMRPDGSTLNAGM
jgi:hypothetical protein